MSRRAPWIITVVVAALFVLANVASYIDDHNQPTECYEWYAVSDFSSIRIGTGRGSPIRAPANQPWVKSDADCRYSLPAGYEPGDFRYAVLDPGGCYGFSADRSYFVYRSDFCSAPPPNGLAGPW